LQSRWAQPHPNPLNPPEKQSTPESKDGAHHETDVGPGEVADLRDLISRLFRGLPQILGLGLLGAAAAAVIALVFSPVLPVATSARVMFSFSGYERGQYPDKSKFQPDDLRAPDIVSEALDREKLGTSDDIQGKVRGALTIEGIIPPNVVKERDRLRSLGQVLPPYLPDEYMVTLSLPGKFPLSSRQREQLVTSLIGAYRDKFQRTYANVPLGIGNAFETLKGADFFEYELVLNEEVGTIINYLNEQIDATKSFRSQTTNLSFGDLLRETELFAQIRLNETLGLIRVNGLSKDRKTAMVKMGYYLQTLEDQEAKATEDEAVVLDLLGKTDQHSQNYVLGVKSQAVQTRPETPILDQGLIDSLLANDAYNFLVRQALTAGLTVKRIHSEKAILLEREKSMQDFIQSDNTDHTAIMEEVQKSLGTLQSSYSALVEDIRKTNDDFERQRFADAVTLSMEPRTDSTSRRSMLIAIVGGMLGVITGAGLSLLGIYVAKK
jgi:hypothetical protein